MNQPEKYQGDRREQTPRKKTVSQHGWTPKTFLVHTQTQKYPHLVQKDYTLLAESDTAQPPIVLGNECSGFSFFKQYPEVRGQYFTFLNSLNEEELRNSPRLNSHASGLVLGITHIINGLENPVIGLLRDGGVIIFMM